MFLKSSVTPYPVFAEIWKEGIFSFFAFSSISFGDTEFGYFPLSNLLPTNTADE